MNHTDRDVIISLILGMMIGFFVFACIAANIQTEAEKEIAKCEQNLPRNVQCKLTAVPK